MGGHVDDGVPREDSVVSGDSQCQPAHRLSCFCSRAPCWVFTPHVAEHHRLQTRTTLEAPWGLTVWGLGYLQDPKEGTLTSFHSWEQGKEHGAAHNTHEAEFWVAMPFSVHQISGREGMRPSEEGWT